LIPELIKISSIKSSIATENCWSLFNKATELGFKIDSNETYVDLEAF
jgi:hypothetical protein